MPADKPIRRAQLVGVFGVGAMSDFPRDESLMTAGLDAWPFAREQCPADWNVVEERLQARLGTSHFRLPPDYRDPGPGIRNFNQSLPFVRFPQWHHCPLEGVMRKLPLFGAARERCGCAEALKCKATARKPFLIPVRIVAACSAGHIEDFPFMEWVHRGTDPGDGHALRYVPNKATAALSGIVIRCSCGQSRSLAGAFEYDEADGGALSRIGYRCTGSRPWLGESGDGGSICSRHLRVLQRGASNVYFPKIHSSIYLPLWGEGQTRQIIKTLENPFYWNILSSGLDDGKTVSAARCAEIANHLGLDAHALQQAAQAKVDGNVNNAAVLAEDEYKWQEYEAFTLGRGDPNSELLVEVRPATDYADWFGAFVSRVCLVRKLRETRVLSAFSRVLPPASSDLDENLQPLSVNELGWLPAVIVRGEGIFIEFDENAIKEWVSRTGTETRINPLGERYNRHRIERGQTERLITPEFILLHTVAHLLIKQLTFDCGYGSASLRERIYCRTTGGARSMHGVLIYTASGDSEGTLGGLVRQGEPGRLEQTLADALRSAAWCSSDPVCLESSGQGIDSANLAACHGCVLLAETTCEEGNRLLDRATATGTLGNPAAGFFSGFIA